MKTVYDFSVKDRKGKDVSLKEYANEVLLIVNTATKCGFTPQYDELEALYKKYHANGFEILDFPCNQFGQQAPGTDESIHEFCKLNFGTEFPRFKKIKVNGEDADPLYKFLQEQKGFAGWDMNHPIAPILDDMLSRPTPTTRRKPISNGTSPSSSLTRKDRSSPASSRLRKSRISLKRLKHYYNKRQPRQLEQHQSKKLSLLSKLSS